MIGTGIRAAHQARSDQPTSESVESNKLDVLGHLSINAKNVQVGSWRLSPSCQGFMETGWEPVFLIRNSQHQDRLERKQEEPHYGLRRGKPEECRRKGVAKKGDSTSPPGVHHTGLQLLKLISKKYLELPKTSVNVQRSGSIGIPLWALMLDGTLPGIKVGSKILHSGDDLRQRDVQGIGRVAHQIEPDRVVDDRLIRSVEGLVREVQQHVPGGVHTRVSDESRRTVLEAGDTNEEKHDEEIAECAATKATLRTFLGNWHHHQGGAEDARRQEKCYTERYVYY
mmetsp:Transcript_45082/g.119642  ORF Transcript_45082/g.119642 Transcript_45082/m.119642 type:complete len:283 (+) Transcript_45082:81-929(+)